MSAPASVNMSSRKYSRCKLFSLAAGILHSRMNEYQETRERVFISEVYSRTLSAAADILIKTAKAIAAKPCKKLVVEYDLLPHAILDKNDLISPSDPAVLSVSKRITANTPANRTLKFMLEDVLLSLTSFLTGYMAHDDIHDAVLADLNLTASRITELLSSAFFSDINSEDLTCALSSVFTGDNRYAKAYKYCHMVKLGLSLFPLDYEPTVPLPEFGENDVLVGSIGSYEQYEKIFKDNFYYIPARHIKGALPPVRYVAVFNQPDSDDPGIRYYAEVTGVKAIKRRDIPVTVHRNNHMDDYYIFSLKEWQVLPHHIAPHIEGVTAPRFTNMFLLSHIRTTYSLFNIHTPSEYRLLCELYRILRPRSGSCPGISP